MSKTESLFMRQTLIVFSIEDESVHHPFSCFLAEAHHQTVTGTGRMARRYSDFIKYDTSEHNNLNDPVSLPESVLMYAYISTDSGFCPHGHHNCQSQLVDKPSSIVLRTV